MFLIQKLCSARHDSAHDYTMRFVECVEYWDQSIPTRFVFAISANEYDGLKFSQVEKIVRKLALILPGPNVEWLHWACH